MTVIATKLLKVSRVKIPLTSKLVLVRHGESQWNLENRFTGWTDVPLTEKGRQEARYCGHALRGIHFQQAFTSRLERAREALRIILAAAGQAEVPVVDDEALNERHYGDLQGMNKAEAAAQFGDQQVQSWRRGYDVAPPNGESLKETAARTLPFFREYILPLIAQQKNVLLVAHNNSLRSILMDVEHLSPMEITAVDFATGTFVIYAADPLTGALKKADPNRHA